MASLIPGFWVARGCPFLLGAVRQQYPTVFERWLSGDAIEIARPVDNRCREEIMEKTELEKLLEQTGKTEIEKLLEQTGKTKIEKLLEQTKIPPTELSELKKLILGEPDFPPTEPNALEELFFPKNSQKPGQK